MPSKIITKWRLQMRKIYLENIPRHEARDKFLTNIQMTPREETISTREAAGRTTSRPVFAALSMPGYHAAAMDGIAVRAEDTFNASDQNPLILSEGESFQYVDTGKPLPENFDAVIKIEEVHQLEDGSVEILAPATPWQHVRSVGEDIVAGEIIVPAHHELRPPDLGALLAGGVAEIPVIAKPRIAILPTGTEIIPPEAARHKGEVPDFNSIVIRSYLEEWGAEPIILPPVPDHPEEIKECTASALKEADAVIIIAGSSAGSKDYTYQAIAEEGEVFVHGVATRPGKPTILGQISGKPAIGLPGYPVSAYMSLEWFVRPLIYSYYPKDEPQREKLTASLGRRVISEIGTEEHVRMAVGFVNEKFVANPLHRGAGVTMSLVRADGLLIIPPETVGHEQDENVEVELYRPARELYNNLLASGSHDLVIDLLATRLKEHHRGYTLSASHLGSMGGITAIDKEQAHLAGIHLLDPKSGEYNLPYVEHYLSGRRVILITLVHRMQGWIVPPGNPDNLQDIKDLAGQNINFVNRQKGAGTRILFDFLLKEAGISPAQIYGYSREEHTHLNVAASVASGSARAGLGILPAAQAFELDFIPQREERYDLLMNEDFYHSEAGEALVEIINNPGFQKEVEELGGYSMREAGIVRN